MTIYKKTTIYVKRKAYNPDNNTHIQVNILSETVEDITSQRNELKKLYGDFKE